MQGSNGGAFSRTRVSTGTPSFKAAIEPENPNSGMINSARFSRREGRCPSAPLSGDLRTDDFHQSGVLGSRLDDEPPRSCKTLEVRFFLKSDRARAGKLGFYLAIDVGLFCMDVALEFHFCTTLYAQLPAFHRSDDFPVATDSESSRAFHGSREFSQNCQVVALHMDTENGSTFQNGNITAGLDAAAPSVVYLVIF